MRTMLIILGLCVALLSGCSEEQMPVAGTLLSNASNAKPIVEKLEIYHFHGTNQCYSCKTVGAYAEETVNAYYLSEMSMGRITFASVNYDLPENKELAQKYGVTGSSLWIGIHDSDGFRPMQDINVWYKIDDKEEFKSYLKNVIDRRLAGDYS